MVEIPTIDSEIAFLIYRKTSTLAGSAEAEKWAGQSGLGALLDDSPPESIPEENVWRILQRGADCLGTPEFGLLVGSGFRVCDLGAFGLQLKNQLTTARCLTTYASTVSRYSSHSCFWLESEPAGVWFCRRGIDLIDCGREYAEQYTVQLMLNLVRLSCGPDWRPLALKLQAQSSAAYRDYGLAVQSVRTGQPVTAMLLSNVDMLKTIQWEDDPITGLVRAQVQRDLDESRPTISHVARELGFSIRTIQRELSLNGLNWTQLIDQVLLERTVARLRDGASLTDIASSLGYNDAANFGRSFKRWTGVTPNNYRRVVVRL